MKLYRIEKEVSIVEQGAGQLTHNRSTLHIIHIIKAIYTMLGQVRVDFEENDTVCFCQTSPKGRKAEMQK